ncbi:hypothetical protein CH373_06845 [Leptospira perolatii]|uniref:Lysoplasmalogenase n=1 Tax=Leptospira perolatii TaxID=2023191 RepID=A0A2M9ZPE0_9LEPT|nr:lysoplasmalogenase [Leptospira perolatii]PJZ70650.1 hypothetical protein CH360_03705 [Leptospira perolatii]PJZ73861.1 hypothetical protein CH373_06845 [Leptospira perolatii]
MLRIFYLILCSLHLLVLVFFSEIFALRLLSKILPIVLLIFALVQEKRTKTKLGIWIGIGLVFSLIGDTILALPDRVFVLGLASFLITQICYTFAFSLHSSLHLWRLLPFLVFGILYYAWLLGGIPASMQIPVAFYVLAICTMGWRSAAREVSKKKWILSLSGASIFIVSDALIALGQFTSIKIPFHGIAIMGTYYLAQYLIFESTKEE